MSFDNPFLFSLFAVFFILVPVFVVRYRKDRKGAVLFASAAPSGDRFPLLRELRSRMIASEMFFLFFTAFLIFALSGPRWGVRVTTDYRRGVDIVLAFDLSRSMNARDLGPEGKAGAYMSGAGIPSENQLTRLERGIEIAGEAAAALADIRMGAAIGKGKGVLAVPLTYDLETIINFLHSLSDQAITGRGTNLESLLNSAFGAFQDSIPSRRIAILFSDGEMLSGSFQSTVEKARKEEVTLFTVGLGSDTGSPVPVEKSQEAPDGLYLAEDGSPVLSARQSVLLKNGAERTGGMYIDGNRSDAARVLLDCINSVSSESRLSGHRREANPRWQVFVLAAMICLGGSRIMGYSRRFDSRKYHTGKEKLPGDKPGRKGENLRSGGVVLLCFFCLLFYSACDNTQGQLLIMEGNFFSVRGLYNEAISSYHRALNYSDVVPYAEFGLGTAYFALDENTAALERYNAAGRGVSELKREAHGELSYRVNYNMGIIFFEKGEYQEAAQAFREALKIDSGRIEAKRNLELSLLTINRLTSPQAASSVEGMDSTREGKSSGSSVIVEYLRQKEQEQWKSREWSAESDSSGPDY